MSNAEGGLLQLSAEGIIGWVGVPAHPGDTVRVVITVNDEPLGTVLANRFDLELVRRQVGIGIPGFAARLTRPPSGAPPFIVTARSSQGHLLGEPLIVASLEELGPAIVGHQPVAIEGVVDLLDAGRLQGWVWNRLKPELVITVDIFDGANLLGRASGDQPRDDLRRAEKRGGQCGFSFELPSSLLDMKLHVIRVLMSGTSLELHNSPLEFGPTRLAPLIQEMARLRQEVDSLTSRVGGLLAAEGTLQRDIIRVLAERIDAYAAIQQEAIDRRLEAVARERRPAAALQAGAAKITPVPDVSDGASVPRRKPQGNA